jgi:hypothetical protein
MVPALVLAYAVPCYTCRYATTIIGSDNTNISCVPLVVSPTESLRPSLFCMPAALARVCAINHLRSPTKFSSMPESAVCGLVERRLNAARLWTMATPVQAWPKLKEAG